MPIQTVESQRLYRQIADQISALIASGEFPEGSRLPSERDLAAQLGVSRPSVREAIIALEVVGKVEVRVGAGVSVAVRRGPERIDRAGEGQGPFDLLRARELIECEITAEAARRAREDELAAIRKTVDDMQDRYESLAGFDAADREFHVAIARATHNSALVSVVRNTWDLGRGALWKRMAYHFQTPALRAAILRDHRDVSIAIDARDPRGARAAMGRHLRRVTCEFNRRLPAAEAQEGDALQVPTASPLRRAAGRGR